MIFFAWFNPKPLRIERRTKQVWHEGYLAPFDVTTQYLIRGRKVLDSEIVPEDVLITLACCGDTGGWKSKFSYAYPELFKR